MIVYTHNDCLKKFNGQNHPERKERLINIINSLKLSPELKINFKEAPIAKMSEITLVHPKDYIDTIFSNIPNEGLLGAATLAAGYFASRAFQAPMKELPRLRWIQKQQLFPAIQWMVRLIDPGPESLFKPKA